MIAWSSLALGLALVGNATIALGITDGDRGCVTPAVGAFAETWKIEEAHLEFTDTPSPDRALTAMTLIVHAVNKTNDPIQHFPIDRVWVETRDGKRYQGTWDAPYWDEGAPTNPYNPDQSNLVWLRVEVPASKVVVALVSSDGSVRIPLVPLSTPVS